MRIKAGRPPQVRRMQNYPPIGNQIDAIYKGFRHLETLGIEFPKETKAWLDKIAAVKEQNPMPTRPMDERFT